MLLSAVLQRQSSASNSRRIDSGQVSLRVLAPVSLAARQREEPIGSERTSENEAEVHGSVRSESSLPTRTTTAVVVAHCGAVDAVSNFPPVFNARRGAFQWPTRLALVCCMVSCSPVRSRKAGSIRGHSFFSCLARAHATCTLNGSRCEAQRYRCAAGIVRVTRHSASGL